MFGEDNLSRMGYRYRIIRLRSKALRRMLAKEKQIAMTRWKIDKV